MTFSLKYLSSYTPALQAQIQQLIDQNKLKNFLLSKYPNPHNITNDKELRNFVMSFKNEFIKKSPPLSKVIFDNKIHDINNALGLHSYVTRIQGGKLKSKNEIRISALFKKVPVEFLQMIVVHELAHIKEKEHNKPFYKLCQHMLANYHQIEFELRIFLTQLDLDGNIYT